MEYQLVIIGAGSAGLTAARFAAELGAKVALIENHKIGGECLWTGCVPSKTILKSAQIAQQMRTANQYGITATQPEIKWSKIQERLNETRQTIAHDHDNKDALIAKGVSFFSGECTVINPYTIKINEQTLKTKKLLICTGSQPFIPNLDGLNQINYHTNETIFDELTELPEHLIIIGGGPISVELGQAFLRLGSRVTLLVRGSHILKNDDPDVGELMFKQLTDEGMVIETDTEAITTEKTSEGINLTTKSNQKIRGTHLLIATGSVPNTKIDGFSNLNLATDKRGHITVNNKQQSSHPDIYAAGDVCGGLKFTHSAGYEATVAVTNAILKIPTTMDPAKVGWCTYTDPEIASVGQNETMARKQNTPYKIYQAPLHKTDRAITDHNEVGWCKIITKPNGKIIGTQIVGAHAGELISMYALALQQKATIRDIAQLVPIYPTLAEIGGKTTYGYLQELKAKWPIKSILNWLTK